jgi:hypothetical protein
VGEAIAQVFDTGAGYGDVGREIQTPANFAIDVHGILHLLARGLTVGDFFDERLEETRLIVSGSVWCL